MKALVYEAIVDYEGDLIARIVAAVGDIAGIPNAPEALESVRYSLYKRYEKCAEVAL